MHLSDVFVLFISWDSNIIVHKSLFFYLVIATVIVQQLNWGLFILCMAGLFIITPGRLVASVVGFLVSSWFWEYSCEWAPDAQGLQLELFSGAEFLLGCQALHRSSLLDRKAWLVIIAEPLLSSSLAGIEASCLGKAQWWWWQRNIKFRQDPSLGVPWGSWE